MNKTKFIKFLRDYSRENLIIVEGKKDKMVFLELDISNVYAIYEIQKVNIRNFKEAAILTDRDKKGKKIYKFVYNYLSSEGIIINERVRDVFFKLFRVVRIEELKKDIDKLKYTVNYGLGKVL